jgi:NAD(P)H-dependent FMN reductase
MEHKHFRILGLAGSLRRASFHRGIVRAAHEVAPEWMSCERFDENGDLVDAETRDRLRHFLSALVEWTQRFEDPTKASQRQARERTV